MPLVLTGAPKARKKTKRGASAKRSLSAEVEYRNALLSLNKLLKEQTDLIGRLVYSSMPQAQVIREIQRQLQTANQRFDLAAEQLAAQNVRRISEDNRRKIERSVQQSMGNDGVKLFDTPEIKSMLELAQAENAALIRTVPQEHFKRINRAVLANFRGETFESGSLANELKRIGGISDRRAKFLARDQTSKLVSRLNEKRQRDAGIEGYIWRNAQDERVVGKPGGKYPEGTPSHMNHWSREGKFFKWDSPPADGHAGEAPGCRCYGEPVIDVEKVSDGALQL